MDEDSMITTANGTQYLRPDYLSPLPTTLDAKKSPLALLAQTCSQIGADSPATKPHSTEKHVAKKEEKPRDKASPSSSVGSGSPKSCFRPYEDDAKTRSKTPAKKESSPSPKAGSDKEKPSFHPYLAPYLVPRLKPGEVCRDPYCVGCQAKPCPQGCLQCEKGLSHHAAAYAQLAALAAAQPYLCSWIGPDASFCGKRFATSEELLGHLRAHTSDPLLHPLLRTYPTPPLSPLRYHPYSKPPLPPYPLPPSLHPSLPPYYPPYALYPTRLGTSHP